MAADECQKHAVALRNLVRGADVKQWFQNQVVDAERAFNNQDKNLSTSPTPSKDKSEDSTSAVGVSEESTAIPNESQTPS
jgi:hypothetical protein